MYRLSYFIVSKDKLLYEAVHEAEEHIWAVEEVEASQSSKKKAKLQDS